MTPSRSSLKLVPCAADTLRRASRVIVGSAPAAAALYPPASARDWNNCLLLTVMLSPIVDSNPSVNANNMRNYIEVSSSRQGRRSVNAPLEAGTTGLEKHPSALPCEAGFRLQRAISRPWSGYISGHCGGVEGAISGMETEGGDHFWVLAISLRSRVIRSRPEGRAARRRHLGRSA